MSGIKSNELQKLPNILGTDTILVDAASAGTARVPFDKAAEFFHKALQEKGLSADNIFLADGETSLSTALSNKADKGAPEIYTLELTNGWTENGSPSWYAKTQDGIGILNIFGYKESGYGATSSIIGVLPEGFRPRDDSSYTILDHSKMTVVRIYVRTNGSIEVHSNCENDLHYATGAVVFLI